MKRKSLAPAVHQHRRTSRFLAHHKNHPSAQKDIYGRLSKNACSPVPLKALESLVLNKIGSITTRPSDPYQFAYKASVAP